MKLIHLSVLQSLMLSIAKGLLEVEGKQREEERKRYMAETCPALSQPSGLQALQVNAPCKDLALFLSP